MRFVGVCVLTLLLQMSAVRAMAQQMELDAGDIPETFRFVDPSYKDSRFVRKRALVVGGTSGIGFAGAAMMSQECVQDIILVGRNRRKGQLAAKLVREVNRSHCPNNPVRVEFHAVDIKNLTAVHGLFGYIAKEWTNRLDCLLLTAGIPGYISGLGDVPREVFLGEHDAILNNVYGTMHVLYEALSFWNLTGALDNRRETSYVPSVVVLASEDGLVPSPVSMYAVSKAALIHLTKSVAAFYGEHLRINALAPGLVDTPFSWNQVRGCKPDDGALDCSTQLPSWQCVIGGAIVRNGDCTEGGNGYSCKCKDVSQRDKRQPLKWPGKLWPAIDPREVMLRALNILANTSLSKNGQIFALDNANDTTQSSLPWTSKQVLQCPDVTLETCKPVPASTLMRLCDIRAFLSTTQATYFFTTFVGFLVGRYSRTSTKRILPKEIRG